MPAFLTGVSATGKEWLIGLVNIGVRRKDLIIFLKKPKIQYSTEQYSPVSKGKFFS